MVIAVYINSSPQVFINYDFIVEVFLRLAKQYPGHQFIFMADKDFDEKLIASKNITTVILGPAVKSPLRMQYRLNYKIPALLRRHKANVFISTNYCSVKTKVPQCIIINELPALHQSPWYNKSWLRFFKNNTAKFLTRPKSIITTSQFLKNELVEKYKIAEGKIDVAYQGIDENFKPVFWQQKDVVKQTYTNGLEFFLYAGPIHPQQNLMALLKAFSFFKKRQKSNMQLVVASAFAIADGELIKSLGSFKYRGEVKLLEQVPVEEMAKITAAAYTLVYPSRHQIADWPVAAAMQSDTPVITATSSTAKEICGDAVLYVNPDDFNDIADKMMLVFKDEDKRFELIAKGRQQAALYQWDKTAAVIWQAIEKCTG